MVRIVTALAAGSLVGCAPCAVSPTDTAQGAPAPAGAEPEAISEAIDRPGLPGVLLTSADGATSLVVFQANTGQPYLVLGDTDNDGVFDMLTYSSLSADGELLVDVEDYGMDGQPDFILNFKKNTGSVFYDGSWREVRDLGPNTPDATVEIDGETRLLREVLPEIGRRPF